MLKLTGQRRAFHEFYKNVVEGRQDLVKGNDQLTRGDKKLQHVVGRKAWLYTDDQGMTFLLHDVKGRVYLGERLGRGQFQPKEVLFKVLFDLGNGAV